MMRAGWVILLLVASHGAALWLGAQRHGDAPVEKKEISSPVVAADGRAQFKDLLERAAARDDDDGLDFEERIQAARERMPADADLLAILEAGTIDPGANFTPETVAALGVWFDRDAMAALHWLARFYEENEGSEFDTEITRYFSRGGIDQLRRFIDAEPGIREYLIARAVEMLAEGEDEGKGGRILKVAGTLAAGADRVELLTGAFQDPDQLEGNLAAISAMLDRSGAVAFLNEYGNRRFTSLLDEVRAAGFPEAAVRRFEEACHDEPKGKLGRNNVKMLPALTNADFIGSGSGTGSSILPPLPLPTDDHAEELAEELAEWRQRVAMGRSTPAEFFAYLKSTKPAGPGGERDLVRTVLEAGLDSDPLGTVAWLRETGAGWREELMRYHLGFLPPEMMARLAVDFPEEDELAEEFRSGVQRDYRRWLAADREACWQSIEALPPGPMKELLMGLGKEEEAE